MREAVRRSLIGGARSSAGESVKERNGDHTTIVPLDRDHGITYPTTAGGRSARPGVARDDSNLPVIYADTEEMLALFIRQPYAELILQGIKTLRFRSGHTVKTPVGRSGSSALDLRLDLMEAGFEAGDFFRQLVDQAFEGNHRQPTDARVFGLIDSQGLVALLQFAQPRPRVEEFDFVVEHHGTTSIIPLVRCNRSTAKKRSTK